MKPKGIKFIELIADKLFLAIFAVIFLGVVALQFVGGGTSVQVGSQSDVPIGRAYEEVVTLAQSKQARMNSSDVAPEAPTSAPNVVDQLALAMRDAGAFAEIEIDDLDHPPDSAGGELPPDESRRFAMPKPGAPSAPVAFSYGVALDPIEVEVTPALTAFLINQPAQQPYDLFAISVESTFDVEAYRQQLQTDPDGAGPLAAIPQNWWNGRQEILDVQVYRREVYEDGGVGAEVLLAPAPGMEGTMRDRLQAPDLTVGELNQLVRLAERPENARQIRQPFFYNIIAGEPWSPPSVAATPDADNLNWSNPLPRIKDVDTATVWAHDVTIEPGVMYQYRVRLVFPNPLKGYEQSIDEDIRDLAKPATIVSAPSPWSATITAPLKAYNFVQRASIPARNAVGMVRPFAVVELYRFYYGYWRRGEARVQAGDAVATTIEVNADLPVWNIEGNSPQRDGDAPSTIDAVTGAYLLDVVAEPSPQPPGPGGRTQMRNVAIYGANDDVIGVRRADEDARSPVLARLSASADAGETAEVGTPGQAPPKRASRPAAGTGPADGNPANPQPARRNEDRFSTGG